MPRRRRPAEKAPINHVQITSLFYLSFFSLFCPRTYILFPSWKKEGKGRENKRSVPAVSHRVGEKSISNSASLQAHVLVHAHAQ
jgi:hypothetical protein